MNRRLTTISIAALIPLSFIGMLTIYARISDMRVDDGELLYRALKQRGDVEAFGFYKGPNIGGYGELWLRGGGFVKFEYASFRDVEIESNSLLFQIGPYELQCIGAESGLQSWPHFNTLGEVLGLEGEFPLSRIFNDYDSILFSVSQLPDNPPGVRGCWKIPAVVHEFYMYPPMNIKEGGIYLYWREALP